MIGKSITLLLAVILFIPFTVFADRYTDNGNDTITDNVTGLIWQKEDDNTTSAWEQAIAACEGLDFAGYDDWRLPNIKELRSIVDNSRYSPAIDTTYFPNTDVSYYWSSTTGANNAALAWYVYFSSGNLGYGNKSDSYYVRCVRGGE
ncbi:MAG: DUF1566 domain-containing protein [Nitrospiraceae bacterium]|nr:MAG: DUF1566 domain-containing protein [Nitrospiraceae bacterium]